MDAVPKINLADLKQGLGQTAAALVIHADGKTGKLLMSGPSKKQSPEAWEKDKELSHSIEAYLTAGMPSSATRHLDSRSGEHNIFLYNPTSLNRARELFGEKRVFIAENKGNSNDHEPNLKATQAAVKFLETPQAITMPISTQISIDAAGKNVG